MIFSHLSLPCKLVPVQYREYEYGLKRNLKMLVFVEGEKPEYPKKNRRNKENQQQTQPPYNSGPESNRATWAEGKCSHHSTIPVHCFMVYETNKSELIILAGKFSLKVTKTLR